MVLCFGKPPHLNNDLFISELEKRCDILCQESDYIIWMNINMKNVHKNMKNINAKKSTGYDNITPSVIKMAADELAGHITKIINHCNVILLKQTN